MFALILPTFLNQEKLVIIRYYCAKYMSKLAQIFPTLIKHFSLQDPITIST